jgi:hypothetical protein
MVKKTDCFMELQSMALQNSPLSSSTTMLVTSLISRLTLHNKRACPTNITMGAELFEQDAIYIANLWAFSDELASFTMSPHLLSA